MPPAINFHPVTVEEATKVRQLKSLPLPTKNDDRDTVKSRTE